MKKKIISELLKELIKLAEQSNDYKKGIQWAVNAVATARFIVGKKK